MKGPYAVVSDGCGNIFELPDVHLAGMSARRPVVPAPEDLIPLPEGSDFFELPGRIAIGYDPRKKSFIDIQHHQGNDVFPVAAFMAPAHIQLLGSAFRSKDNGPPLPLYSYTAVGWLDNRFYVAGKRIDPDVRQDLAQFDFDILNRKAHLMVKRYPDNRLVQHLVHNCVFQYGCPAARNFVYQRWECPIPTSIACNSKCVGCLSKQSRATSVPAAMARIAFTPSVKEIIEYCVPHLNKAPRAVVSFGQGCEGEPLVRGDLLEEVIVELRKRTKRGIINLNTNGSKPEIVEKLCRAGLDSIRISLNSAQEDNYDRYFQPQDYTLAEVFEFIRTMDRFGRWISLNYFIFPGFSDLPSEFSALENLLNNLKVDMIQTRNINIDPELYSKLLDLDAIEEKPFGVSNWIDLVKSKFPNLKLGYFNPPRRDMKRDMGSEVQPGDFDRRK